MGECVCHPQEAEVAGASPQHTPLQITLTPRGRVVEEAAAEAEEEACSVCSKASGTLLLCDGCDTAFHLKCCTPVLRKIPKGDWFCAPCKQAAKAAKEAEAVEAVEVEAPVVQEEKPKAKGRGRRASVAPEPVVAAAAPVRRGRKAAEPVAEVLVIAEEAEAAWAHGSALPEADDDDATMPLHAVKASKSTKRRMSWAPEDALERVRHFRKENAPVEAANEITPKLSAQQPAPKKGRKAAAAEPAAVEPVRRATRARK
jgi:hypothetical protein